MEVIVVVVPLVVPEADTSLLSNNLQTPCANHVFPEGTLDVLIPGKEPLFIEALNTTPSRWFTVPDIFSSF
jgi:hypothetical protein